MAVTREEKLAQLERVLQCRALQGSENLKAFLKFVALRAIENQDSHLKEYVIATEVFGRSSDYNSRIDSVVRVQAGRLRAKLQEYYATEGKEDKVIIDLPKGSYAPIFSYALNTNGSVPLASLGSEVIALTTGPRISRDRWLKLLLAGLVALALALGFLTFNYRSEALHLRESLVSEASASAEPQAALPLWGDLLTSPEPLLVVFSNTIFQGSAEEGMKLFKPLDSPGSVPGSPAMNQYAGTAEASNQPLVEHYTGIGEVMGVYFLGEFFAKVKHPFRVKRSLLLTWDDMKTENMVVLGSPAENFFLRDLPQKQDFIFRPMKDEQQRDSFGIINTRPKEGEQRIYLAKQEGPSRSQISEDYAVVSLLQGLDAKKRLLILAGITTLATQASAEYMTRPDYVKDLITHLNIAPAGKAPQLPPYYQVLIKVKVNAGVPIQISYVTHHVLQ
jgi:hypothetical protein